MTATSKNLLLIFLFCIVGVCVSGCDSQRPTDETSTSAQTSETSGTAAEAPLEDAAVTVIASDQLPNNPQRIVSLAPNMTEILFALGAGSRVVAVTNYCDYPPVVESLPEIGGFINPDIEAILSHKPDLVVGVTSAGNKELPDKLTEAGLPYAFLEVENIEQTREAILFMGSITGKIAPAAQLVASIDQQLLTWSSEIENPPTVMVVYGYEPLVAAGPDSFAHELITKAGAKNVLHSAKQRYGHLDGEKLIELDPDIIIDAAMAGEGQDPPWEAYPTVTAVANGDIIKVSDPAVMRPGPRMVKGFAELSGQIQTVAKRKKTK